MNANTRKLIFGAWNPIDVAINAKNYLESTGLGKAPATPGDRLTSGGNSSSLGIVLIGGLALIVIGIIAARLAMGWYVGKQFNRPVSGSIVGGIFGPKGLGVLSLFPGDK
jgi:hypothetical protein